MQNMICSMTAMISFSQKKAEVKTCWSRLHSARLALNVAGVMSLCERTPVKTEFRPYLMMHTNSLFIFSWDIFIKNLTEATLIEYQNEMNTVKNSQNCQIIWQVKPLFYNFGD